MVRLYSTEKETNMRRNRLSIEEQYRDIQRYQMETWRAFLRRVQNVIEYLPDGSTVQHKKGGFPCDTK